MLPPVDRAGVGNRPLLTATTPNLSGKRTLAVIAQPINVLSQSTVLVPPPPNGVRDRASWKEFCESISRGGGVFDHPRLTGEPNPASREFYENEVGRVEHHSRNAIPFLIDHCGLSNESVLEFGSGTAGLSVAMVQAGVRSVDGVEPVRQNHEAARWRVRAYGLEESIQCHHVPDTSHLPFPDAAFDAVVCSSVLQYIHGFSMRRVLLTEMSRAIRPGGRLIVSATGNGLYPAGPHSSRWWSNLFPKLSTSRGHDRGITFWEMRRALAPLGFRILPQGRAAVARWKGRLPHRQANVLRAFATTAIGAAAVLFGPITRAHAESFLPYPDLVFQKGN